MRELNFLSMSHIRQTSVQRICEIILTQIVVRIKPFFLQFTPKRFGNIQMWRIRREEEQVQSSVLPIRDSLHDCLGLVYSSIVKYNKGCTADLKRESFQKIQNKFCIDIFLGYLPSTPAFPVDKSHTIKLVGFIRQKTDILICKLPAIRNIAFTAQMGFISIIKVYFSLLTHYFKFFKFFNLKLVMLRFWFAFRSTSDAFISSAKVFKKALKVLSHTFFPLSDSHCALAVRIRCRLDFMAERIAALSSVSDINALRPRPDLVCNPAIPSSLYRFTQLLMLTAHMPVIWLTSLDLRPSDFSNMLWQRILKQWLAPCLIPSSNSLRWVNVTAGVLARPIMDAKIK